MVTISNSTLPGVYAIQESVSSVDANTQAPADVGVIGDADLTNGSASADSVYRVTNEPQAVSLFGNSPLAAACADALQNGAYPVYAMAVEMTAVSGEEPGVADSGTLANTPVTEVTADVTFTVDGSPLTSQVSMNPAGETLAANEAAYNPNTGAFNLGVTPSTSLTVDYKHGDYSGAITAMLAAEADRVDFLGVLTEESAAVSSLQTAIAGIVDNFQFVLGVAGAGEGYVADTSTYSNPFDTSRMQLLYPSRNDDNESLVGAYLGMRGRIGIDRSGMRKKLVGQTGISHSLTRTEKEEMDGQQVVVIELGARSVRTMSDHTCVASDNADEQAYNHALARLIGDFVTLVVHDVSDPFIGLLHTAGARANLRAQVQQEMKNLLRLNAIVRYTVSVEEIDSVTARVTVGMELAKPLRNIEAVVVGGDVN